MLDHATWSAITGPLAPLAVGDGDARGFQPDVCSFTAVRDWHAPGVWDAIVDLVGPGGDFALPPAGVALPAGWEVTFTLDGVQLVETDRLETRPDDEAVELGADDVPEMLGLVALAQPGPFLPRTYLMGRYVGIRRGGALVAMAGERMHPVGWTEISAVATHPDHRGQGLAARLVRDVAHHIRERGDGVYLHTTATNPARALYAGLGFRLRQELTFGSVRTPA
ncbi:GNAT family N-acetyltransferase [Xylanimonas protaetiae]|uniref:GNAT family N-acetyltransferase n=1 Tax=Xylanimonas protaetiae TaxID=2509457 RepID=A0A4P6F863_9MICO|nr:GNAT family N-acetyltransferase [Xylanimonas protaetiae]